jgi:hypothetical protein
MKECFDISITPKQLPVYGAESTESLPFSVIKTPAGNSSLIG